jgi:hypothetical protein
VRGERGILVVVSDATSADAANLDIAPFSFDSHSFPPRRPSAVTISGDDSFARGLRTDPEYLHARYEWSFVREPTRAAAAAPMKAPVSGTRTRKQVVSKNHWRCPQVGEWSVKRLIVSSSRACHTFSSLATRLIKVIL